MTDLRPIDIDTQRWFETIGFWLMVAMTSVAAIVCVWLWAVPP